MADFVFPDLGSNYNNAQWLTSRAILCPTNEGVENINQLLLDKFPGAARIYQSNDKVTNSEERQQYPEEFLNTHNPSGMPPYEIHLKEKAPIILLRNIDPIQGNCNGTKYIVNRALIT